MTFELFLENDLGVSLNGGTPKTPQNDPFLLGKPMVVGYHHFRKPPFEDVSLKGFEQLFRNKFIQLTVLIYISICFFFSLSFAF